MTGTETRPSNAFVRALSRTERHLLMLFYVEELDTTEIGLVLDLAESKVVSMLTSLQRRARPLVGEAPAA